MYGVDQFLQGGRKGFERKLSQFSGDAGAIILLK